MPARVFCREQAVSKDVASYPCCTDFPHRDRPSERVQQNPPLKRFCSRGPDTILGREEELATVTHFLHHRAGPRALLLEGEAGMGKTTLWRVGVRLAADQGRVLTSRPSEAETRLSFTVLGDLLAAAFEEVQAELPGGQQRALRSALLLELSEDPGPDPRAVALEALGVLRAYAALGR
jgi:hypothetical protein